ncbi:glycosyltransferase family 4 protein [Phaeobacter gallaeciensis]|uniref:glycosyltransferase family 4 protein n=1 Tax=Phaeobacter gallaeciensis TaxID=60890 RepID=UPI00237EF18A|nr:glycosyltransferase family 4 protein [Phaeobacter gallaeciensis]MDE4306123.1 glycosyltransferase family 4 protein [Phaeobacter gallaeciensis]MDE4310545.1 glycosyltransferase family 4 protein [Phaeobacter gallaeciensis]MDE4315005.1 glycosyltransferase family 4 protein [Phaeobacter gallaeciensis]MDE4319518.1 glycosyltransferase family 4 protein [Phaeobacter gallaeciensis]MDE4323898.1 glycosyltransferase family 4 protein [Phaeobacter gallaeciensis]
MKLLFVHQNMPGQYRELITWLAARPEGHEIYFLTQRSDVKLPGVTTVTYKAHHQPAKDAYGLSKDWEAAAGTGIGAALAARQLKDVRGWSPDIIIGHTGWGELTFLKEVWPDVPMIGFFEYFYRTSGGLVGFDPENPPNDQAGFFAQARNTVPYTNIHTVDLGHTPTYWQRDRFPESFHDRMYVCHDGIRTDRLQPDPEASISLGRLDRPLTRDDEVITYVARNMERARGFHIMMRALPKILKERPNARVLMIGGNETSYGIESKHPGGLRGEMEEELQGQVDWSRVHFLGRIPYDALCDIIRISRCHIYLTMPFVLSWSLLESMAMQATVVAADVAPVREAVTHGTTGMLVDFFDPDALAAQVVDVVANPESYAHLGPNARAHVVETYDFLTRCLPEHIAQINALVPEEKRIQI